MHMCHNAHIEVRGQPPRVHTLLPTWAPGIKLELLALHGNFAYLNHLADPVPNCLYLAGPDEFERNYFHEDEHNKK